ncbi:globin-like protein [Dichomitus squalens]|uniref:nitric oxide dioxygenase n=1 Tax=Dichomitus squalens TaxID=114155 RepID=A0A4Q9NF66_9APHY|nr:globin-like protein [Dichomitus squalens]TBU51747.1 globin-like protein [Dichomitus squalens]
MPRELPHADAPSTPRCQPMTPVQRKLISGIVPVLEQHGNEITTLMYKRMLAETPLLMNFFSQSKQDRGHQPEALAHALLAYASHIEDLTPILPFVERIAHKHASIHIEPAQYEIVAKYLTDAIIQVVGADVVKGELAEAWISAYWNLAYIFIDRERELYEGAGWVGWREFIVDKKVKESDEIMSFYFKPKDGKPLEPFRPGQYISVQRYVPKLGIIQNRQYSLSDAHDPDYYRISVKREDGIPTNLSDSSQLSHPGWISNILHETLNESDTVELAYPFGEFVLDASSSPVVLLSAGIGLTPLLSMLNTLVKAEDTRRHVSWVQAVRNGSLHPFKEYVASVARKHPDQVKTTIFYSNPQENDVQGTDYDVRARLDLNEVDRPTLRLDDRTTQYYVCGPGQFMADMFEALKARGVEPNRLHAEVFGPGATPQ